MKKHGGMMYPSIRAKKRENMVYKKCGKALTPASACYYVDSCNCAITDSAPPYCPECYREVYGK